METPLTGRAVERRLGISQMERRKLEACGLLARAGVVGRAVVYEAKVIADLASRQDLTPPRPCLAVRLGDPADEDDPRRREWRRFRGWSTTGEWTEEDRRNAVRGVWQVAEADDLIARRATLIAVVSIFVVGAWTIVGGYQEDDTPAWIFELEPHRDASRLTDKKLRLGSGPLTRAFL